jgi:hypothetical protein
MTFFCFTTQRSVFLIPVSLVHVQDGLCAHPMQTTLTVMSVHNHHEASEGDSPLCPGEEVMLSEVVHPSQHRSFRDGPMVQKRGPQHRLEFVVGGTPGTTTFTYIQYRWSERGWDPSSHNPSGISRPISRRYLPIHHVWNAIVPVRCSPVVKNVHKGGDVFGTIRPLVVWCCLSYHPYRHPSDGELLGWGHRSSR